MLKALGQDEKDRYTELQKKLKHLNKTMSSEDMAQMLTQMGTQKQVGAQSFTDKLSNCRKKKGREDTC